MEDDEKAVDNCPEDTRWLSGNGAASERAADQSQRDQYIRQIVEGCMRTLHNRKLCHRNEGRFGPC